MYVLKLEFSSCCQIFQQLSNDNVAAVVAPSVSILEAHNARRQAYKDTLQQGIVDPDTIDVTFNVFPYYSRYASDLPLFVHHRYYVSGSNAVSKARTPATFWISQASIASGAKEVNTTIKESSRPERASVFAKRAPGVEVSEGNISIFDTGLGMDDTNIENGGSFTKCDDLSEGKTIMPIEFQVSLGLTLYSSIESLLHVNGEDLAEIPSVEVAVTHLNSCNGLEFVLQFRFELNHGIATTISSP
ncbi:hypothetical protein Tco_0245582, partial [Tanacetum coccineum]